MEFGLGGRAGPMAVVNVLCSMLRSSGREIQAHWLLRRTWKSYRSPEDTRGKSYARYNYNYGMALLERGFIKNPIVVAEDMNNMAEWKTHADQNAYEFFARAYAWDEFLPAGARLASVLAYRVKSAKPSQWPPVSRTQPWLETTVWTCVTLRWQVLSFTTS